MKVNKAFNIDWFYYVYSDQVKTPIDKYIDEDNCPNKLFGCPPIGQPTEYVVKEVRPLKLPGTNPTIYETQWNKLFLRAGVYRI